MVLNHKDTKRTKEGLHLSSFVLFVLLWLRKVFLLAPLVISAVMFSCRAAERNLYEEQAEIMGTTFTIKIDGPGDRGRAAHAALEEIRRIDRLLSTYKETSEISEVNRRAFREPVAVGADFRNVLTASRIYFDMSGGAFDPTVYALMRLWDFSRREGRIPSNAELERTLPLVGLATVTLDESTHTVRVPREGMSLDFGGIAKGYAVDRAVGVLRRYGIQSAIIDAGGNFYALGTPRSREYWRAGIRHPLKRDEVIARLPIANKGVSTSGNYERFFEIGGKKYCHIMDPRTGMPVERMLSATVVAESATAADALSTSVFVLGPEKGMELIERLPEVEGMIIVEQAGSPDAFSILVSSGLQERMELLLPSSL